VFVNQLTTATISLVNTTITVDRRGTAAIMLTCTVTAHSCEATLTLTAQRELWSGWSQDHKTVTVVIGTASASVPSGETTTVDVHLNHRGRKPLAAGDGHLPATLRIAKQLPKPEEQTDAVELVRKESTSLIGSAGSGQ
jgi:hypothetical protein